jgi:long-chain-acyl-CoA dehydrogenase
MQRAIFDSDHDAFRASVRGFVARSVTPHAQQFIDERRVSRSTWQAAGDAGLLGLQVPEAYGGQDARDYRFTAVLIEELAKSSAALASAFAIHCDVVAPYLVELTSEDQKRRWLPSFCSGRMVTAMGMTEASGGSDLAALKTSARSDGDAYVLNGSKTFITNGYHADLVVIAARTNPDVRPARGITLFAVESGMAGFTRGRKLAKVGQPESDAAELFFDDVRVPAANVIGSPDHGFIHMMKRLAQERLGCAVASMAHVSAVLDETLDYARQRRAFGTAIGSLQANKFLLAELVTSVEVAQAYVDACVAAYTAGNLSPVDAAKAKWWSAQVQNDVLDHCVQLHGGYGFMTEYRVARAWMDARVTKIWAGSNEIMKELIGRDMGL